MHRLILMMLTIVLVFMAGAAGAEEAKVDLDLGAGYRIDKVKWNISYTEDDWDDMDIVYTKARVRISYKRFYARGSLGYGRIIGGNVRESYYSDLAHQSEVFRITADTDGYVFDASIGIGPKLGSDKAPIIPLIGYSWNYMYLETEDATPSNFIITLEPRWQGPWIGLDFILQPSDRARLFASAEYHFGDYRAQAHWPSMGLGYDQIADAEGFVLAAGLSIKVKDSWDIGLESQYTQWTSDVGQHGFAHAGFDVLNEAKWESLYGLFNITHRF